MLIGVLYKPLTLVEVSGLNINLCPVDHFIWNAEGYVFFFFLDIVVMSNEIKFYMWKVLK